jgi:glyoxylase-like metal-dependent hydrolase (beta-lactamase superfamily II)
MDQIDLRHLGRPHVIGSWMVGDVLIDPGPESCQLTLLEGLAGRAPRAIALTHIHLDHAGGTGALLRSHFPEAEVWVHERGARHMVDPSKLLASAGRLYGDEMERLWGEVVPVAAERIRVLTGGETLDGFEVAYTPGHASHHVSYLHKSSGTAFCGDVAGVRIEREAPVLAPTPPPDIDLPAWRASLEVIESWAPAALVPTHFGRHEDVSEHLRELRESLQEMERLTRAGDERAVAGALRERLRRADAGDETIGAYEQAMPPDQTYAGMKRYLEKASEVG